MSALLVVLVLTVQRTGFGAPFRVMAIGFAAVTLVMGTLTAIRVNMASQEDACLVAAMNRLRHAYVDLAPEIEPCLTVSTHDDDQGVLMTYAVGQARSVPLHVMGSTSFFLMTVNAIVAGTLGALVASAVDASTAVVGVVGVLAGLVRTAARFSRAAAQPRRRPRYSAPSSGAFVPSAGMKPKKAGCRWSMSVISQSHPAPGVNLNDTAPVLSHQPRRVKPR